MKICIDGQVKQVEQAGWFLRPDSAPSSECPQFVDMWSDNTQETQTQKMDQNFEIRIVIFDNFLTFSKRRCVVPLWPIWTIMVATKLDQSKVLVTKFHQNRLTLKGRSAGQRHTDTQTGANFKTYLLHQFCSNRVEFFYNAQETQAQKMMDQNFEIRIL